MSRPFDKEAKVFPSRSILKMCGIAIGADFHTLHSAQIDTLLEWADACRYRKPRNAAGSRARYFHEMLQRRASGVTVTDARANFRRAS
jgi:hypothetical protein